MAFNAVQCDNCPPFVEDITGSTDLNTGPCHEEVTKVHSSRGYNCVRTW